MLNNKLNIVICALVWGMCAFFAMRGQGSSVSNAAHEFVVEKEKSSSREKKYSELQEELVLAYEELLRTQTEQLHKLADAQEQCLDALRKAVINTPKMARVRVEKEIVRVNKQIASLEAVCFF